MKGVSTFKFLLTSDKYVCPHSSTDPLQSCGQCVSGAAWKTLTFTWQRLLMSDSHHSLWGREEEMRMNGSEGRTTQADSSFQELDI